MKKFFAAFVCVLLILTSLSVAAFADDPEYVNLGSATAGRPVDIRIGNFAGYAEYECHDLPAGCTIETEISDGVGIAYLRGTPGVSGDCCFTVYVTEGESNRTLSCSLKVYTPAPTVIASSDVSVAVNAAAYVSVTASSPDGATLSYAWYSSTSASASGGTPCQSADASSPSMAVPTSEAGTYYYYCVVTNDNNGYTNEATSGVITVTVAAPTPSALEIVSLPQVTSYKEGDKISITGIRLKIRYSDGSEENLSDVSKLDYSPKTASVGSTKVTLTNGNLSCSYDITVEPAEKKVTSVSVVSKPDKLEYTVGDTLVTKGLKLRVYKDKDYEDITTGFFCSPSALTTAGSQKITVFYGDFSDSFTVTVEEKNDDVRSIYVDVMPSQISYKVGEKLNTTGMVLGAVRPSGTQEVVKDFVCSPVTLTEAGSQKITVSYEKCSTYFYVTVVEDKTPEEPEPTPPATSPEPGKDEPKDPPKPSEPITKPPTKDGDTVSPTISGKTDDSKKSGNGKTVAVIIIALVLLSGIGAYAFVMGNEDIKAMFAGLISKFTSGRKPDDGDDDDYHDGE